MLKSKKVVITITFLIFVISFLSVQVSSAKTNEITDWKVMITSDTKELKDTKEIEFRVEENKNVVNGKIAPGLKATATIEIDLSQTTGPVDIYADIEDDTLLEVFLLKAELNGKDYSSNQKITIEEDRTSDIQVLTLELEWINGSDALDTYIGTTMSKINIPITVYVEQHI